MITLSSKYNEPPPLVWDKFCTTKLERKQYIQDDFIREINEALREYSGKLSVDEMDYYTLEFEHEKDYLYFLMEWS